MRKQREGGRLGLRSLRGRPVEYKAELVRRFGASGALEKLASGLVWLRLPTTPRGKKTAPGKKKISAIFNENFEIRERWPLVF